MAYQSVVQKFINSFSNVRRALNKYAEALPTLASKVDVPDETIDVRIIKKTLVASEIDLILST